MSMFRVCSYNLHGYNSTKTNYIKLLLNRCEILDETLDE